jgi:Synergist-CTERM protein sorting domain-containing protein
MSVKTVTRTSISCSVILLLLLFSAFATEAASQTWTVENGESIQVVIDSASPGDTIQVEPGTYEEFIEVNKGLRIEGTGEGVVIRAPEGSRTLVLVPSSDVTLKGLTFEGVEESSTGIDIYGAIFNVQVRNCTFRDMQTGLWIVDPSMNVVVANCIFENVRDYGIDNETSDNTSVYFRVLSIGNRFTFDSGTDPTWKALYAASRKGSIALFNTFENYAGHWAINTPDVDDYMLNATGNYWGEGAEDSDIDAACSEKVLYNPWAFADAAGHADYQLVVPNGAPAVFDVGASAGITISIEDITTLPPMAFPLALAAYGDESPCPTTVQGDNPDADSYTAYFILQDVESGPVISTTLPSYRMTAEFPKAAIGDEADLNAIRLYSYDNDTWVDITEEDGLTIEVDGDTVRLIIDDYGDPGPIALTAGNGDTSSGGCSATGAASLGLLLLVPFGLLLRSKK